MIASPVNSSTTVATAITFDGITTTVSKCYPGDGSPVAIGGSNCTDGALTVPAGALPFSIPGGLDLSKFDEV